jgi:predicted O-methyltransferase YrrM
VLAQLREETAKLSFNAMMQIAPEQGAFMGMIAAMMGSRTFLEIGTFTGYSSLVLALACKALITAEDVSEEWTSIARKCWAKATVADRITLQLHGGHAAIADLPAKGKQGSFDLCFLDTDIVSCDAYYEGALQL